MIVVRSRASCQADRLQDALAALASRTVHGVIHYDVGQDVTDPGTIIVTAVFPDHDALDRQATPPEVEQVMALVTDVVGEEPEATVVDLAPALPSDGPTPAP
jgi:quinol monooxygenase YgiN